MLNEEVLQYVQNQIDECYEKLLLSMYCDTSFDGSFYLNLRESSCGNIGNIYLLRNEMYSLNGFNKSCIEYLHRLEAFRSDFHGINDAMKYFNYRPYIKEVKLERDDYDEIITLLINNPYPDAKGTAMGLDGHNVVLSSFVGGNFRYDYWVYPPYEHLRKVTNTISKYIGEPFSRYVYIEQPLRS